MTLLEKLKALHEIEDRLDPVDRDFIANMWALTVNGTDDLFLHIQRVADINWLYKEYIGDEK